MYCKKCGAEIKEGARFCEKCGAPVADSPQKPKKKQKAWKIILGVFIFLVGFSIIGNSLGNGSDSKSSTSAKQTSQEYTAETQIVYASVTVDELIDLLQDNALKAKKTYLNQYVEVTGRMDTIDSSGKYIGLYPQHTEFSLTSVLCSIKTEDQEQQILDMTRGDIVTVRGKIRDVGEVMGYALDIDEIVK